MNLTHRLYNAQNLVDSDSNHYNRDTLAKTRRTCFELTLLTEIQAIEVFGQLNWIITSPIEGGASGDL